MNEMSCQNSLKIKYYKSYIGDIGIEHCLFFDEITYIDIKKNPVMEYYKVFYDDKNKVHKIEIYFKVHVFSKKVKVKVKKLDSDEIDEVLSAKETNKRNK